MEEIEGRREEAGDVVGDVAGDIIGDVAGGITGDVDGDGDGDITGDGEGDITGDRDGDVAQVGYEKLYCRNYKYVKVFLTAGERSIVKYANTIIIHN